MNNTTFLLLCLVFLFGLCCGSIIENQENPNIYWATITKDDGLYCYDQIRERFDHCDGVKPSSKGTAQTICGRYVNVTNCEVRRAVPSKE